MKAGRRSGMLLLLFGALVAVPNTARGADAEVTIKNTAFNPQVVTVTVGGKVVWKDEEGGHDVTFDDGSFKQPPACTAAGLVGCTEKGNRIERTFDKAGAFKYHCSRHGSGMSGLVNVQAAASEVTTTTTVPATVATQPPTTVTTASTTTTTRKLATSSTLAPTTTSTAPAESTTTLPPNEAPAFDPGDSGNGDGGSDEASPAGSGGGGGDSGSGTVALIVAALLAVAGGGGVLLWRLRPRSAQP